MAYEIGYRGQPTSDTSLSISTYYNNYTSLRNEGFTPTFFPIEFTNTAYGITYGVEVWGNYNVADWWTLGFGFKVRHQNLIFHHIPIADGPLGAFEATVIPLLVDQAKGFTGNDTDHQFSIRSSMALAHNISLDAELREIGALPMPALPSYVELNARVGWRITKELQLSLTGSNLLHARHIEFTDPAPSELQRSFVVRLQRSF